MFVGDDALIGLAVAGAFLLRIANAFIADPLPLFQTSASVAMGLDRSQRGNRHVFQSGVIFHGRSQRL
jgi:hypothetical protein